MLRGPGLSDGRSMQAQEILESVKMVRVSMVSRGSGLSMDWPVAMTGYQHQPGVERLWSQFGLAYGYDGRSKRNLKYLNFSNFFYKCEGKINLKNAS